MVDASGRHGRPAQTTADRFPFALTRRGDPSTVTRNQIAYKLMNSAQNSVRYPVAAMAPEFHQLHRSTGNLLIGGVPLAELTSEYGTPLYVFDADVFEVTLETLRKTFSSDRYRIYYSIKANPTLQLLERVLRSGLSLDACSRGDLALASRVQTPPEKISFTGVGLTHEQIQYLARLGVRVNLDSLTEVGRWVEVAPGRDCGLRVIPDVIAGFHPHCRTGGWGGKFGIPIEAIPQAAETLSQHGCATRTLHCHLGSSVSGATPYLEALDRLLSLATVLSTVDEINLGGGFAARFHPDDAAFPLSDLEQGIRERIDAFYSRHGRFLRVAIEPGEFLTSEAGYLATRVRVKKHSQRYENVKRAVITDGGMNLIPAPSLYGSYLHIYVEGKTPGADDLVVDVYGPTNQTGDALALNRTLPPLREGDLLLVRNAGAYAWSRSTQFNEHPRPGEVWVERGTHWIARENETFEVLFAGQYYR